MLSSDAKTALTIDRDNTLTVWNLNALLQVIQDPTSRPCQLANIDQATWTKLAPASAYPNPCQPPPLPNLGN
jgi:hypothetical protein